MTVSTAAYTKTSDLVTGRNQYVGKGRIQLVARGSVIGMNVTLNCGGIALADDNPLPFIGTTGALSVKDHIVIDQVISGGRIELFLRNVTAGAVTTDYALYFTPL
jgi:hypothetical protein